MIEWAALLLAPFTGIVSYLVGKRQRNNDFLNQLQASINMLVEENTKLLAENVELRTKVAALQVAQNKLLCEIKNLRKDLKKPEE